jgi:hypothetical protein
MSSPPWADSRRARLRSARGEDLLEAVEDQIEPELELGHILALGSCDVLLGVLGEVRVLADGFRNECLRHVFKIFVGGVTRLPQRGSDDVAVQSVVGTAGQH